LPDFAAARQLGGQPQGHNGTVTHLAASPASDLVASAGRDGTLKLWNYTSGGLLRSFANTGAPVTALCMHPNDQILIGGHADGAITLWSLSTGQALERMTGHGHPVSGLALAPGGDRLYSAPVGEGPVYAWDLSTILSIRLPFDPQKPGMAVAVQEQAKASGGSAAERRWMTFAAELARWRQRFDIELVEFEPIRLGEFDIEL
jgi:WD40 repeat protein